MTDAIMAPSPSTKTRGLAPALPGRSGGGGALPEQEKGGVSPVESERALWRAVIVQALMDASCGSAKQEAQQDKHDALIWLRGNSRDFFTVAWYAGFEPEYLREMVARSLEGNCRWRALPGEGERKRHNRPRTGRKAHQRR